MRWNRRPFLALQEGLMNDTNQHNSTTTVPHAVEYNNHTVSHRPNADQVAELGERRLETSAIDTVPGLYRKAVITDPEGNMISLGENLSTDA